MKQKKNTEMKFFFLFHPSGLIPFPFGLPCPFRLSAFFFSFFFWKNIFLRGVLRLSTIGSDINTILFVSLMVCIVTSFSCRICGARKKKQKEHRF
ncbi:hypothetical protein [Chryseobacterium koreense]|uniref:hypothetical protein n=1 Tax=Chryseobacterium koreense TaxID=232216 RepID=UPI00128E907F|nr:hypothetical protein [Chryseobacterium koreense]MBB5334379.1 hypothetical protein [Chryseobacterium koreense]